MGVWRRRQNPNPTQSGLGFAFLDGLGSVLPLPPGCPVASRSLTPRARKGLGSAPRPPPPALGVLTSRRGRGSREHPEPLSRQLQPQPGLARGSLGARRGGPPPSSLLLPASASASFLCLHPQPLSPSVWGWAPSPQSARALDVGAGQVHGPPTQDGQPLHQHCGPRGPEPAECGHPGHAGGGVGVLQVRTQPSSSLSRLSPLPGR